jgi:hypothetical protein
MTSSAPALVPSDRFSRFCNVAPSALLGAEGPEMPEEPFWALVERLNWTDEAVDPKALAQGLARELDLREALAAAATCSQLRWKLFDRFDEWALAQGMSLSKLVEHCLRRVNHVIGRGRTEYERVLADPGREVERIRHGAVLEQGFDLSDVLEEYPDEVLTEALRQLLSPKPLEPDALEEDAVVEHPLFGIGVVADISDGRAQVVFPGGDLFVETGRPSPEGEEDSGEETYEHSAEPESEPPRDSSPPRPSGLVAPKDDGDFRRLAGYALSRVAPKMPEERFWALVERIGWADESVGHEARGKALAGELDVLETTSASSALYRLTGRLRTRLEEWEEESQKHIPCGDDRFSDLCNHIVGLGRAEYERVWENPALALERAERRAFRESFAYVFIAAAAAYSDEAYIEALRREASPRPFDPERLEEDAVVEHPRFGVGVVYKGETTRVVFSQGDLEV